MPLPPTPQYLELCTTSVDSQSVIVLFWDKVFGKAPATDEKYVIRMDQRLPIPPFDIVIHSEFEQDASLGNNFHHTPDPEFFYEFDVVAKKGTQESSPTGKKKLGICTDIFGAPLLF